MKKKLVALLALAGVLAAGNVMAADVTVIVSANVISSCTVNDSGAIQFGSLDPITAPLVDTPIVTNPKITCTNGATWYINDKSGSLTSDLEHDTIATQKISYTLTYPSGDQTGSGEEQDIVINGSIAALSYQTAAFGSYEDTVTLTLNY